MALSQEERGDLLRRVTLESRYRAGTISLSFVTEGISEPSGDAIRYLRPEKRSAAKGRAPVADRMVYASAYQNRTRNSLQIRSCVSNVGERLPVSTLGLRRRHGIILIGVGRPQGVGKCRYRGRR